MQAIEAVRAVEDGALSDIREGDVGAYIGMELCAMVRRAVLLARYDRRVLRGGAVRGNGQGAWGSVCTNETAEGGCGER